MRPQSELAKTMQRIWSDKPLQQFNEIARWFETYKGEEVRPKNSTYHGQ